MFNPERTIDMELELHKGAHLYTSTGEDLGRITQFVVAPKSSEVTHVKVEKGLFFPDDRVVPVDIIDHADADRVVLSDEIDPSALPRFVLADYAPLDEDVRASAGDYAWRYPIAYGTPFPSYPVYPMSEKRVEQINDPVVQEEVEEGGLIAADAPVLSVDGKKIGTVSEIEIDPVGRLSHLVVDLGFLEGERALPGHWIQSVDSEGVRLAVGDDALESLEKVG
jgi:sporulation protein YlmC with PRC-barrel domain